jgi:AcrR family transcriptional regulator
MKQIFFESFEELVNKKHNINDITVQQIVDNCGASRSSFYRCFRDKYDLMVWVYGKELDKIVRALPNPWSYKDITFEIVALLKSKQQYFVGIAKVKAQNSFQEFIREYGARYLYAQIKQLLGAKELSKEYRYSAQASCAGFTYILIEWLKRDCDTPVAELAQILNDCMAHNLYLLLNAAENPIAPTAAQQLETAAQRLKAAENN